MSAAFVLALVVLTILVLANEWMAMEVYALLLIFALVASGILAPEQAFAGFANSAVIMIAGVMILSGALLRNGAVEFLASRVLAIEAASERTLTAALLGAVNLVSAFINNVAATALFSPIAEGVAKRFGTDPARYLMPVAFASMTGGVCTLIGTSTNIAVSRVMRDYGLEPLSMFELTPVGVVMAAAGVAYLLLGASRTLRSRPREGDGLPGEIKEFLFELRVLDGAGLAGRTLREIDLAGRHGVTVLAILRGDERIEAPRAAQTIRAGDLLLVTSSAERIARIQNQRGLEVKSMPREHLRELLLGNAAFVEATVAPNSPLVGRTLQQWGFRQRYGVTVLAVHRREGVLAEKVGRIPLRAGDVLLLYGTEQRIQRLMREASHVFVESVLLSRYDGPRALLAAAVFVAAATAAGGGWLDAPTAFLGGAGLAVAARCLPPAELGAYVNLRFLVLIAGMVALGTAMEQSGAAEWLASLVGSLPGSSSPRLLLAAFFVASVALTQPLNNAAAALLLLPVAVHAAAASGFDARPFVVVVTVAASCSFITPFEPANLLVYAKGHYRFVDFARVGSVLTVLLGAVCLTIVPWLWPVR